MIHDCKNDSANLFYQFGINLVNVFDTQVSFWALEKRIFISNVRFIYFFFQAAHAVIEYQNSGKPVYKVKNANLNTLCELYGAPCNLFKEQLKSIYRRDQRYWARRPLTRDMIAYASSDVQNLVPLIYNAMFK